MLSRLESKDTVFSYPWIFTSFISIVSTQVGQVKTFLFKSYNTESTFLRKLEP